MWRAFFLVSHSCHSLTLGIRNLLGSEKLIEDTYLELVETDRRSFCIIFATKLKLKEMWTVYWMFAVVWNWRQVFVFATMTVENQFDWHSNEWGSAPWSRQTPFLRISQSYLFHMCITDLADADSTVQLRLHERLNSCWVFSFAQMAFHCLQPVRVGMFVPIWASVWPLILVTAKQSTSDFLS